MPLLDHFHPPLHGPRRWEGFHHAWATGIARHLNLDVLPKEYYAEPEISIGPTLEIDVATAEWDQPPPEGNQRTRVWSPSKPKFSAKVDFSRLDGYEIRVYKDLGGAQLCAAIELVSPANKDRPGSRQTFAAKCAGYLKHGIGLIIVDVVTERNDNLHEDVFEVLEAKGRRGVWKSPSGLYAVSYRAVTSRKEPRLDVWPEVLEIGQTLPTMPLWLSPDLAVPVNLEASYLATCESLRIPAA